MSFPNFLIIGAEKAGTTSLYHYLNEHPEIYMSKEKEPFYFICKNGFPSILGNKIKNDNFIRTRVLSLEKYKQLFDQVSTEKAIGEASASYIYVPEAAKSIKEQIPNAKLIVVLRNPAERAYSNFLHCIGRGVEPLRSFEDAIAQEQIRIEEGWGLVFYYKEKGYYYKYLKTYFDLFKSEQIKIFLYEDFKENPIRILKEIFNFLDVDSSFTPEVFEKHNVSKKHGLKHNTLTNLLKSKNPVKLFVKDLIPKPVREKMVAVIDQINSNPVPVMLKATKKELINDYKEDILKLQGLINCDLSHWLA